PPARQPVCLSLGTNQKGLKRRLITHTHTHGTHALLNSWDSLYTTEIANNSANPSDIGTVWFDDSDAEAKILDFLASHFPPSTLPRSETSFLDLGCGNGSLLFALRDDDQQQHPDDEEQEEEDKVEARRR